MLDRKIQTNIIIIKINLCIDNNNKINNKTTKVIVIDKIPLLVPKEVPAKINYSKIIKIINTIINIMVDINMVLNKIKINNSLMLQNHQCPVKLKNLPKIQVLDHQREYPVNNHHNKIINNNTMVEKLINDVIINNV